MRSFFKTSLRAMAVGGCLLMASAPQIVLAEGAGIEKKEERKEPQWIPAYFLVALGIGLGMMCVARASSRIDPDGAKDDQPS